MQENKQTCNVTLFLRYSVLKRNSTVCHKLILVKLLGFCLARFITITLTIHTYSALISKLRNIDFKPSTLVLIKIALNGYLQLQYLGNFSAPQKHCKEIGFG